jgi:hypothetical protein
VAPAAADVVSTAPSAFCDFPGTYRKWLVFDFEGNRFHIPLRDSDWTPMVRGMNAEKIGFRALLNMRDFSPLRDEEGRDRVPRKDAGDLVFRMLDDLDQVTTRFRTSAFDQRYRDGPSRTWEEPQPNGLNLLRSTLPGAGESVVYIGRGKRNEVTELVLCPSKDWMPIGPRGRPACDIHFREVVGMSVTFDAERLDNWRKIRKQASNFARCALNSAPTLPRT